MKIVKTYKNKDGRERVYYRDDDDKPHVVSYPRILMEEKLGRPLEPYEDVHHKDNDKANNDPKNLEVVLHGEHQRNHGAENAKYHDLIATCCICGKKFVWTAEKQRAYYIDLRRGKARIISCSKNCSSYYGRQEQLGRDPLAECRLNGET